MSYMRENGETEVVEQVKKLSSSQNSPRAASGEQGWTDPVFPPNIHSIVNKYCSKERAKRMNKEVEWKRASEIWDRPRLFCDGIQPTDVVQGMLGDCYFLAVLSSLAEHPDRILALIEATKVSGNGRYELNFFVNGMITSVEVDDYFPVKKGTRELAFAQSELNDMWVPLIEKGWAKLHGSYLAIEGGIPSFAATHLTGVPTMTWRHEEYEDHDDFWEMLKEAERRQFTIMASSLGSGEIVKEGGVV